MTTTQGTATAVGAVIVFWLVGAYNRLVRLRPRALTEQGVSASILSEI